MYRAYNAFRCLRQIFTIPAQSSTLNHSTSEVQRGSIECRAEKKKISVIPTYLCVRRTFLTRRDNGTACALHSRLPAASPLKAHPIAICIGVICLFFMLHLIFSSYPICIATSNGGANNHGFAWLGIASSLHYR